MSGVAVIYFANPFCGPGESELELRTVKDDFDKPPGLDLAPGQRAGVELYRPGPEPVDIERCRSGILGASKEHIPIAEDVSRGRDRVG